MQRGILIETIETIFGQTVRVGSWVGWGGRDGNLSSRRVGVVEELEGDQAKVAWYSGPSIYRSRVGFAKQLFVLDPRTINAQILSRWTNDVGRRL